MGTKTAETVKDGRRTVVWESDFPVSFFNVIAGRWQVERGEGTAVYYYRGHPYNIGEMREALDAARRYYSEWFYPYPWRELKLSEFPNLATYAQGFPTNITFSEGIGFLTSSTPGEPRGVRDHRRTRQPISGGATSSRPARDPEATSSRKELPTSRRFCWSSRPRGCTPGSISASASRRLMARIARLTRSGRWSRSRRTPGDTTVTYDKGGWVFWMLLNHMGRDRALAGIQAFIKTYQGNPDHPVLQDFLASMRPFAADAAAFDAFTRQWFFEVVVPEYQLHDPKKSVSGDDWEVTVRVENVGTGDMPVEIAATRGERFNKGRVAFTRLQRGPRNGRAGQERVRRTSSSPARSSRAGRR